MGIQRANLDGSNQVTLVTGLVFPQRMSIAGGYLYWADESAGKIQRAKLDGSEVTDILTGLPSPVALVVIDTPPIPVSIDIRPGSNPQCHGTLPIAILGSETLDVTQIDPSTLSFEGLNVRVKGNGGLACSYKDANGDGFIDLVCQFQDEQREGALEGELVKGTQIEGTGTYCFAN
jgi:hypothetical protein